MRLSLVALTLLGLLATQILADGAAHDGQGDDQHKELSKARQLQVELGTNELQVQSHGDSNSFQLSLSVGNENRVRLRYHLHSQFNGTDAEAEVSVRLYNLIEFVDVGVANGVYDAGVDAVANTYAVGAAGFNDIQDVTQGGAGVHSYRVSTSDSVVTVVLHFSDAMFNVSGISINPASAKFDIDVRNYVYVSNDSNARLAFEVRADWEQNHEGQDHHDAGAVTVGDAASGVSVGFSWATTVTADGTLNVPILASAAAAVLVSEDQEASSRTVNRLFYTVQQNRASTINWDPTLGVASLGGAAPATPNGGAQVVSSLVVILICVALAL